MTIGTKFGRCADVGRREPAKPDSITASETRLTWSEPAALMMLTRDIGPWLAKMAERMLIWSERCTQRRALMRLDDRMLRDIGVSRYDAEAEFRKPFWR